MTQEEKTVGRPKILYVDTVVGYGQRAVYFGRGKEVRYSRNWNHVTMSSFKRALKAMTALAERDLKGVVGLVFALLALGSAEAQTVTMAKDNWLGWDKCGHFISGSIGYGGLRSVGVGEECNIGLNILMAATWEVINSTTKIEGIAERDGFSYKDIIWNMVGVMTMKAVWDGFEWYEKGKPYRDWKHLKDMIDDYHKGKTVRP